MSYPLDHELTEKGGWTEWGKYILFQTKQFSEDISSLKVEFKEHTKSINTLENELIKLTSSNEITSIKDRLSSTDLKLSEFEVRIKELENFKIKAVTITAAVNTIFGIALGIAYAYISR